MKLNKSLIWAFILLLVIVTLYRVIPNRPLGFAPQYAMAVFCGAIFVNHKRWAFLVPVLSMFASDLLYQVLYNVGFSTIPGFYEGQWQNYLLFALLAVVGFFMRKINLLNIVVSSVVAPTIYFLLSNFVVWAGWQGTRGYNRPRNFSGLVQCYVDGLPFYYNSVIATMIFSGVFFGAYYIISRSSIQPVAA